MKQLLRICLPGLLLALLLAHVAFGEVSAQMVTDELGRPAEERYTDETGELTEGPEGYAIRRFTYSADGARLDESYYNACDDRILDGRGWFTTVSALDGQGRAVRVMHYDADGVAVRDPATGMYGEELEWDAYGYICRRTYLNRDGQAAMGKEGWATVRTVNDAEGRPLSERWFNAKDKPVMLEGGYAGVDRAYDEAGRVTRETYLNLKEKPAANAEGVGTRRSSQVLPRIVR